MFFECVFLSGYIKWIKKIEMPQAAKAERF